MLIAHSLLDFLTPARTRRLRDHFDPITRIEGASSIDVARLLSITEDQARGVTKPLHLPAVRRTVEELRERVITILDGDVYPPLLAEIHDPPPVLHFRGRLELLKTDAVAMVGSRRASPYGLTIAHKLGRDLVKAGLTIVSGLARGIDAAAHESALRNDGATIAVLGTGIDVIYPRFHRRLFEEIATRGLLLTEFAPATPARPIHFPIRNRVIAGLSLGTIVVEASSRSGSLITARLAAEEGREVFAVPGSVLSSGSEGVHRLIQQGAKLLHRVEDVFEELRMEVPRESSSILAPPMDQELGRILSLFTPADPIHIDHVLEKAGRSIAELSEKLLQLELEGYLRALPGGRYVRMQ